MKSKILRKITNAPFYVSNQTIHSDLKVPFVLDYAIARYKKFHEKLPSHLNPLVQNLHSLYIPGNPTRRLSRQWPRDLLQVKRQTDVVWGTSGSSSHILIVASIINVAFCQYVYSCVNNKTKKNIYFSEAWQEWSNGGALGGQTGGNNTELFSSVR